MLIVDSDQLSDETFSARSYGCGQELFHWFDANLIGIKYIEVVNHPGNPGGHLVGVAQR